jgi:hypothetical protein
MHRDIKFDELLVQRIPVRVSQCGAVGRALARVGIDADADEAELLEGPVQLGEGVLDGGCPA